MVVARVAGEVSVGRIAGGWAFMDWRRTAAISSSESSSWGGSNSMGAKVSATSPTRTSSPRARKAPTGQPNITAGMQSCERHRRGGGGAGGACARWIGFLAEAVCCVRVANEESPVGINSRRASVEVRGQMRTWASRHVNTAVGARFPLFNESRRSPGAEDRSAGAPWRAKLPAAALAGD